MKKRHSIVIIILIALIIFLTYSIFTYDENANLTKESRAIGLGYKNVDDKITKIDYSNELCGALKDNKRWKRLFISDNFKKKYINRKGILPNINSYCWFSSEISDEENIAVVYADKKEPFLDFDDSDAISTLFYFKYFLDNQGDIDDIELLKQVDIYSSTGELVN